MYLERTLFGHEIDWSLTVTLQFNETTITVFFLFVFFFPKLFLPLQSILAVLMPNFADIVGILNSYSILMVLYRK